MANKITYTDKIQVNPKKTHVNQFWADDANEIKAKHNLNDDRQTTLEANFLNLQVNGAITYQTLADLNAVAPIPDDGTPAVVANDPEPLNNGSYSVVLGAWLKNADLLYNGFHTIRSSSELDELITSSTYKNWLILDDFTLDSDKILPEYINLFFNGGVIEMLDYKITGNNTTITAGLVKIFDTTNTVNTALSFDGKWNVLEAYPQWFGAIGSLPVGVNVDDKAFQDTINFLNNERGGVLRIPDGTYGFTVGITTYPKVKIIGSGTQSSFLWSYISGSGVLITMDGLGLGSNTLAIWKDFSMISQVGAGWAVYLTNCAFASYENIYTNNFAIHWRLIDCLSSEFSTVRMEGGPAFSVGVWASNAFGSNPNALTFNACVIGSQSGIGIRLDDPSNFNMYGGSIEGCGAAGLEAVKINNGGSQGGAAWNFNGVYFEANKGVADINIAINGSLRPSTGTVQACSFNRISQAGHTNNNILLQQVSATDDYISIDVRGNSFISGGDYIPSASTSYIGVVSAAKFRIIEESNLFYDEIETPQIFSSGTLYSSSIDVDFSVYGSSATIDILPTDGNAFTINEPSYLKKGQEVTFTIINTFGTLGELTFFPGIGGYRLQGAWIQPVAGAAKSITFKSMLGVLIEVSRSEDVII